MILTYTRDDLRIVWPAVLATWPTIADGAWIGLSYWCEPHDRLTGARVPA